MCTSTLTLTFLKHSFEEVLERFWTIYPNAHGQGSVQRMHESISFLQSFRIQRLTVHLRTFDQNSLMVTVRSVHDNANNLLCFTLVASNPGTSSLELILPIFVTTACANISIKGHVPCCWINVSHCAISASKFHKVSYLCLHSSSSIHVQPILTSYLTSFSNACLQKQAGKWL